MKHHAANALALIGTILLAGCGSDPAELHDRARKSHAAQDFNAARIDLISALREDPANRAMLALLADIQLRLGDGEGARTTIRKLARAGGAGAAFNRLAAEAELLSGKPERTLELLGNDASADAWRVRAAAMLAQDLPDRAIAAFESGLAAGGNARLLHDYARFRLASGDLAGARGLVERLKASAPNSFQAIMMQGDLAFNSGETARAAAYWRDAASRYPSRYEPLLALAGLASDSGKPDEALELVEKAGRIAPGNRETVSLRIQLLAEKGDWKKVRELLQKDESSLSPASAEGLTYAEALLRLDQAEQAGSFFSRALLLNPQNRYARMMLGESRLAAGDAAGAWSTLRPLTEGVMGMRREIELAERAARQAGIHEAEFLRQRLQSSGMQETEKLSGAGHSALARRDWPAAIDAFRRLAALGDDPQVLKRLAFALSQAGHHAEAIASADKALVLAPDDTELVYTAGLVRLNGQSDMTGALGLLARAVRADPGNTAYRNELARARAVAG